MEISFTHELLSRLEALEEKVFGKDDEQEPAKDNQQPQPPDQQNN